MSIFLLMLIAIDLWGIYNIVKSDVELLTKLLWGILIVGIPYFGFIIWYLLGPKAPSLNSATA